MADKTDLERAVDEMISDLSTLDRPEPLNEEDAQYWRAEYWAIKDEYDAMVCKLEELVRTYCG